MKIILLKSTTFRLVIFSLLINIIFLTQAARSQTLIPPPTLKKEKIIYLTFDADMTIYMKNKLLGGQVKEWYDPKIINYLEEEKIPATIFVTGLFTDVYPQEIKQWSDNSLQIENHTYDHSAFQSPCFGLSVLKSDKEKISEINKTQKIIFKLTNKYPKLFRYPGLCHNSKDDLLVKNMGLLVNNGNLTANDAFNKNYLSIVKTVISQAKDKSIILMHLGGPNAPATNQALRQIIPQLKKTGYIFKSLEDYYN